MPEQGFSQFPEKPKSNIPVRKEYEDSQDLSQEQMDSDKDLLSSSSTGEFLEKRMGKTKFYPELRDERGIEKGEDKELVRVALSLLEFETVREMDDGVDEIYSTIEGIDVPKISHADKEKIEKKIGASRNLKYAAVFAVGLAAMSLGAPTRAEAGGLKNILKATSKEDTYKRGFTMFDVQSKIVVDGKNIPLDYELFILDRNCREADAYSDRDIRARAIDACRADANEIIDKHRDRDTYPNGNINADLAEEIKRTLGNMTRERAFAIIADEVERIKDAQKSMIEDREEKVAQMISDQERYNDLVADVKINWNNSGDCEKYDQIFRSQYKDVRRIEIEVPNPNKRVHLEIYHNNNIIDQKGNVAGDSATERFIVMVVEDKEDRSRMEAIIPVGEDIINKREKDLFILVTKNNSSKRVRMDRSKFKSNEDYEKYRTNVINRFDEARKYMEAQFESTAEDLLDWD